jgi:2-polyprenyl-6-methoxyphenol hydroxylase-like FAD-dependent oxidoreductase
VAKLDKVLVVGGGVAGMSCAIQLRRAGIAVELIDIDPNWRVYGAGITITGPTLRALRTLGVLEAVVAQGATWSGARLHDQSGTLLQEMPIPPLTDDLPATGGIMRPVLHNILSTRTLQLGTEVRLGLTVAQIDQHGEQVTVQLSDGSHSRYDLVIGADGIFSRMREHLFPQAPRPSFTGQVVYRLVAERPAGFDRTHFFMGADSKLGFNPVSDTHMYMFLLHAAPDNPWVDPKDQPRKLYQALAGFGSFVPGIRETVLTTNAHTINYRPLEIVLLPAPWHSGRVVLAGDAAHATTPHLASGAGMAIEDGIVLAEELQTQPSVQAALESYIARRFERCRLVVENSVRLGELEMHQGSPEEHACLMSDTLKILRAPI